MAKYELLPERLQQYMRENTCTEEEVKSAIENMLSMKSKKFYTKIISWTMDGTIPRIIELEPRNPMSFEERERELNEFYNIKVH